jgi:hypothetical protein
VGQSIEQRIRKWLGDASEQHDVAVIVDEYIEPVSYAISNISANKGHLRELELWRAMFKRHQIERLIYGVLMFRRHARTGQVPFTSRRVRSPRTNRASVEWMFAWESAAARPDRDDLLLSSRPVASPAAELVVRHQAVEGDLRPLDYTFRTQYPFDASLKAPSWAAYLFSRCDGGRTGAELFEEVEPNLSSEGGRGEFLQGLAALIAGGFVEIEPFRIPRAAS